MAPALTDQQKAALSILVNHPDTHGPTRDDFYLRLRDAGVSSPLPLIKCLSDMGLMRFDQNADKKGGRFKPLRPAWEALGLS